MKLSSYLADFKPVKNLEVIFGKLISYFAEFEQVKNLVVILVGFEQVKNLVEMFCWLQTSQKFGSYFLLV